MEVYPIGVLLCWPPPTTLVITSMANTLGDKLFDIALHEGIHEIVRYGDGYEFEVEQNVRDAQENFDIALAEAIMQCEAAQELVEKLQKELNQPNN